MIRTLTSTVAGVALGAVVTVSAYAYGVDTAPAVATAPSSPDYGVHHTQRMAIPRWMTRPCAEEDSANCYWDAHTRGNLHGRSFYARRMPHTGRVCLFYVHRSDARVSDQCYRPGV